LAATFMNTPHVGVGGPNLAPAGDGPIARCVAHAPGGPIHVLLTDHEAEHLPGCNMAFRKEMLEAVGGFDPQFRIAGDDVDVCWKLQEMGWTLGFHAAAVVWHHRRNSVKTFLKQQLYYGKAEADLERKWPHKYNAVGHATWSGRLYSKAMIRRLGWWSSPRIYHGTWGSAPFQTASHEPQHPLWALPTMPEWWIVIACLCFASLFSILYPPMRVIMPITMVALAVPLLNAAGNALNVRREFGQGRINWFKHWALTTVLHVMQPLARLSGRLGRGLTPWRRRGTRGFSIPWPRRFTLWSERWQAPEDRLRALEALLRGQGAHVRRGGDFDRWDLEVRAGMLGAVRIDLVVEEHGQGRQLVRFRAGPRPTGMGLMLIALLGIVSIIDASVAAWQGALICGIPACLLALRATQECAAGMAAVKAALTGDEARRNTAEKLLRKVKSPFLGAGVPLIPTPPPDTRFRPFSAPKPSGRDHVPLDAELAHEG
jgi:hypothetical protein